MKPTHVCASCGLKFTPSDIIKCTQSGRLVHYPRCVVRIPIAHKKKGPRDVQ